MVEGNLVATITGHRAIQKDQKTGLWISKLEYKDANGKLVTGNSEKLAERVTDLFSAYFRTHPELKGVNIGMANGVDLCAAKAAIITGKEIYAFIPYTGHGKNWRSIYGQYHADVLKAAHTVHYPPESEGDFAAMLLQRNKDMVDSSDYTLTLWDGSYGGTSHCVNYSKKKDKKVVNLWNSWVKYR